MASLDLRRVQIDRHTQHELAGIFIVRLSSLELLGDRVDVAEALLKRARLQDRAGTRRLIERTDDFLRGMNRMGGGQPDGDALRIRRMPALLYLTPGVADVGA